MPSRLIRILFLIAFAPALLIGPQAARAAVQTLALFHERFIDRAYHAAVNQAVWDTGARRLALDLVNGVERAADGVAACSDGSLIVVGHYRVGDTAEAFAQRLDSRGFRMWPADVRLTATRSIDAQSNASVVVNAACQAIVVWQETGLETHIYAQKLDADGDRLWPASLHINTQPARFPRLALAAADRLVIAYLNRDETLVARQIDWSGVFTWSGEKEITAGCDDCRDLALAADGAGNVVAAWSRYDSRYDERSLLAQKLSAGGAAQWVVDLDRPIFTVNAGGGEQLGSLSLAASTGGVGLVWLKITADGGDNAAKLSVYTRGLDASGQALWSAPLLLADTQAAYGSRDGAAYLERQTAALISAAGEILAAWTDERSAAPQVYTQKISAAGAKQWSQDKRFAAVGSAAAQVRPLLALAAGGTALAVWSDARGGPAEAFAQALTAAGERAWTADQRVFAADGNVPQSAPAVSAAPDGKTLIAFSDARRGVATIYLQKLGTVGAPEWDAGLRLSASAASQTDPSLAAGGGAVTAAWVEARTPAGEIYAQQVDASGAARWAADVPVNDAARSADARLAPAVTIGPAGEAYVAWQERTSGQASIYLQKLSAAGGRAWSSDVLIRTFPVAADTPLQFDLAVEPVGNFVYLAWDTGYNLEAQKVSTGGALQWSTPPVVYGALVYDVAIAIDPARQPVIAWTVALTDVDFTYNVYAQKLNAAGAPVWDPAAQISAVSGAALPVRVDLAIDPAGRAVAVWDDASYGVDGAIYAQAFDAAGQRLWAQDARVDAAPPGARSWYAALRLDASGQAFVAWLDHRNGFGDLYAQSLSPAGARRWSADTAVVTPESFYFASGQALSSSLAAPAANIAAARLDAAPLMNGGALQFYLSNTGGADWVAASPYRPVTFAAAGSDLRWRVDLAAAPGQGASPQIAWLTVAYSDGVQPLPMLYLPYLLNK